MKSKKITNENVQVIPETVEAVNEAETASDELAAALSENAENAESVENAENPQEAAEKKKSVIRNIIDAIGKFDYAALIMTLLGAYLSAMAYVVSDLKKKVNPVEKWQDFMKEMPIKTFVIIFVLVAISAWVLHLLLRKKTNISAIIMFGGAMSLSWVYLWKMENYYYCIGFILVSALAAWFCYSYGGFKFIEYLPKKGTYAFVVLLTLCMAAFISVFSIFKHLVYWSATFDFGIFLQMYHYMAETFEPLSTCERDKLLSHFAVHFSPIFYVLLPVYYIFPSAKTLFICQGVLAASGAIPLMLICKNKKFGNLEIISFSIVYLFSCAIVGPCFYDFHENAFLPPLLMWFFYAIEKRKTVLMYVFMVLLLMVKEDAALYVALIGYYCIFAMEKKRHGAIIFSVSVIYFVVVTGLMSKFGEGVMTSRTYGNLMVDHSGGLGEVVKTVILNPVYFITQCISEESFKFFLMMLLPLGFLPLISKKLSNYFLAAPFILTNLASGYHYAQEIGFQYVFGTATCLIYCALINYDDIKAKNKQFIPVFMSVATLCSFASMQSGKTTAMDVYMGDPKKFQLRDEVLAEVPENASVAVFDSFTLTRLAQRKEVYLLSDGNLNKPLDYDFIVLKDGYSDHEWLNEIRAKLPENGYLVYSDVEGSEVTIYVNSDYKGEE